MRPRGRAHAQRGAPAGRRHARRAWHRRGGCGREAGAHGQRHGCAQRPTRGRQRSRATLPRARWRCAQERRADARRRAQQSSHGYQCAEIQDGRRRRPPQDASEDGDVASVGRQEDNTTSPRPRLCLRVSSGNCLARITAMQEQSTAPRASLPWSPSDEDVPFASPEHGSRKPRRKRGGKRGCVFSRLRWASTPHSLPRRVAQASQGCEAGRGWRARRCRGRCGPQRAGSEQRARERRRS